MTTHLNKLFSLVLISILFLHFNATASGLKGTYTINPSSPASSLNYVSFNDADSDLLYGSRASGGSVNGPGVSDEVVFNVASGSYFETLTITNIIGASANNTITFQSAARDSSKAVLKDSSSAGTLLYPDFILCLDKASFVTFKQIGFQRISPYGAPKITSYDDIIIFTNGSDSDTIMNCWISGDDTLGSSNLGSLVYCGFYKGLSSDLNQYNAIINNRMVKGYCGISWDGYSSITGQFSKGCRFEHNFIDSVGQNGIAVFDLYNLRITNNKINLPYGGYGILLEYINSTSVKNMSLISNNFISVGTNNSGNSNYGLLLDISDSINVVFNSINIYGPGSGTWGLSGTYAAFIAFSSAKSINLYNNNFINLNSGAFDYAFYADNVTIADYNNIYSNGGFVNYGSIEYANLSSWKKSLGKHDISVLPLYTSDNNLYSSNPALINGKPITNDTLDIDGNKRNKIKPCIGSNEFTPPSIYPRLISLSNPAKGFCTGIQSIKTQAFNLGLDTIRSVHIQWSVNGVSQADISWKGLLLSANKQTINLGSYNFSSASNVYKITLTIDSVNGLVYSATWTDSFLLRAGMKGTYLIDNSGKGTPDYTSFRTAVNDLTLKGLCGATVFNVADGIYNESVTLRGIVNSSPSNTIVFQSKSNDSSRVILDTSWGNYNVYCYTLGLFGASYTSFHKMTISNSAINGYANTVDIAFNSHNITFSNDLIRADYSKGNSGSVIFDYPNSQDNNLTFLQNHITGGYNGLLISGCYGSAASYSEKGVIISKNIIDSSYFVGINASYTDSLIVSNNNINLPNGSYGISSFDLNINSGDSSLISDNFITTLGSSSCAIYISYPYKFNIYDNSFFSDGSYPTFQFYNYYSSPFSATSNLNGNIICNKGSGQAVSGTTKAFLTSDYNDFYAGKIIGTWNNPSSGASTVCNTISKWRLTSAMDAHSISSDPAFINPLNANLHIPDSSSVRKMGVPIPSIKSDIDGQKRDPKTPDIGADEYKRDSNDIGAVAILNPLNSTCGNSSTIVSVKIVNFGYKPQTGFKVHVIVNSTDTAALIFTGSLKGYVSSPAPDTIVNILVPKGLNTSSGGLYSIQVYTILGNDINHINDTVVASDSLFALPKPKFYNGNACLNDSIHFIDSSYSLASITKYLWSFSNGDTASGKSANVIYSKSGKYDVKLKVQDGNGCMDSITKRISIDTVNASFAYKILGGLVDFYPNDSSLKKYRWDFGDKSPSDTSRKTSHIYGANGKYKVNLIAVNTNGCSDSTFNSLNIIITNIQVFLNKTDFNIQVYPNPFQYRLNINFKLEKDVPVKIEIFDASDKFIATLLDFPLSAGIHDLTFNLRDHGLSPSGIYFIRITLPDRSVVKPLIMTY